MSISLDSIFWHDGRLVAVSFDLDSRGAGSLKLALSLYASEQARDRAPVTVFCRGVSRFHTTLDVGELKDNARAGNVSDGESRPGKLLLNLTGGVIEVEAKEISADAC
jgi:hypothetical protein